MDITSVLHNFDPIQYLGLNDLYSEKQKVLIRAQLNRLIGEYIMLKLSPQLSPEIIDGIAIARTNTDRIEFLNKHIPDFRRLIVAELENFKKEFQDE